MDKANETKIRHVACAVRGRLANRNAVQHAINLAAEHGARLTFFLVISSDFLAAATPTMSPTKTLFDRLAEIGEYLLFLLHDQAIQSGVSDVENEIQIGDIRSSLREFAERTNAQVLVMGRPSDREPRSIFTPHEFPAFVEELEDIGELKIEVIDPENVS
ncbi:MAG: universal stress protein [Anaerolineales bacterium]|nr:universal stress protein [Anaerolineales bacterium]